MIRKLIIIIYLLILLIMLGKIYRPPAEKKLYNEFSEKKSILETGEFRGKGEGFVGTIEVILFSEYDENLEKNLIKKIEIVDEAEVESYFKKVEDAIINKVIKAQNPDVDSITGATESSMGLISAIKDGWKKAEKKH